MEQKQFKTEEEAIEELKKKDGNYTKDQQYKFCPLINCHCQYNCECFVHPRIKMVRPTSNIDEYFIIKPAYCGNAMFTGERYCQQ